MENTRPAERDENGQYTIDNPGAGKIVQNIEAQTPDDLKQQIDNIQITGRTECKCNFTSAEAIRILRQYNDSYKETLHKTNNIDGYKQHEIHSWSKESMAFVLICSDGVKLPLKLQLNYINYSTPSGEVKEETFKCFEYPPVNDSVNEQIQGIRELLNDTMYL